MFRVLPSTIERVLQQIRLQGFFVGGGLFQALDSGEGGERCFYFFALLFTSPRSPLSERLEQATSVVKRPTYIAIQLVLQQYCKTICTFFVARFTVRLNNQCIKKMLGSSKVLVR